MKKGRTGENLDRWREGRATRALTRRAGLGWLFLACVGTWVSLTGAGAEESPSSAAAAAGQPSLEETRLTMDKWIETQQIIAKERKDWQQGKEILQDRLDLVQQEIKEIEEKVKQAKVGVDETHKKRESLVAENNQFVAGNAQLTTAVTAMESEIRGVFKRLPDPIQTKLRPLYDRIPTDASNTRVSAAERFQNVLGILNELNKSNNEIAVSYEVHTLGDGKPAEVKAIYVGLAQAYYVSVQGEAGIGKPAADGWKWESSPDAARNILSTLDILQGKQTPAFVPLPMKIQ